MTVSYKPSHRGRLRSLLLGSATTLMTMGIAAAQTPASTAAPPEEEIVVTGSHIRKTQLEVDVPVVSISGATLAATGITNLADSLNQLPQFGSAVVSSTSSNFFDDLAGISTINLRNLGDTRTLVLIDGRRTVSGVPVGKSDPAVDVGAIPAFLIDSVDIVTGGGSASYGSEAVAGVVNIRLKDHYEGLMINEQYGLTTDHADSNTEILDLLAGTSFADDRGHVVFGLEYQDQGTVFSKDREISAIDRGVDGTYQPSSYSKYGTFGLGPDAQNETGLDVVLPGGRVAPLSSQYGFNRNAVRLVQVPTDRISMYGKTSYDITDDITFFVDGRFSQTQSTDTQEPIAISPQTVFLGFGGPALRLPLNNPYVPAALRAAGIEPDGNGNFADWRRRFTEQGDRGGDSTRTQWAVTSGLKGNISDSGFKWEAYYAYSEMDSHENGITGDAFKLQQSLLAHRTANGTVVCNNAAAVAAGCVPVNIFGPNTITPAALAWFDHPTYVNDQNKQYHLDADVNGSVLELPYGDLRVAAGFEYRREDGYSRPDSLSASGGTLDTAQGPGGGGYDVSEYYIETEVPILKDLPGAKSLALEGSWRYSDYSNPNVGGKQSYRYGLTYAPIQDIQFHIVNSVAIRAPTLSDLYAGFATSASGVTDPCSAVGLATAPNRSIRIANCKSFGIADPETFVENIAKQQSELSNQRGNSDLTNERAEVLTYGVNFQPRWISGLSGSVDFFAYKIANAIQTIDQQTAADQCADTLAAAFCLAVRRNPAGNGSNSGLIIGVDTIPINVGSLDERGIDVQLAYGKSVHEITDALLGSPVGGDGRIDVTWNYEYLQQLEYTALAGVTTNQRGLFGAPHNKWYLNTNYSDGTFDVNWRLRYEGSQSFAEGGLEGPTFSPVVYNDIRVDYHLNDWLTPYVGVNNLFNVDPGFVAQQYQQLGGGVASAVTGTNSVPQVYDVIGRMIYFGVKFQMPFDQAPEEEAAYTPPPAVAPARSVPKSYLVFFDFNKSDLTPQAVSIVDQAAANAGPAKVTQLTVTGHTDTVGSDAYNLRLSRRRAESVAAQLGKDGIPSSEISIVAKGKRDLLVPTADGVKEPQNRRVQIVYDGGPTP